MTMEIIKNTFEMIENCTVLTIFKKSKKKNIAVKYSVLCGALTIFFILI